MEAPGFGFHDAGEELVHPLAEGGVDFMVPLAQPGRELGWAREEFALLRFARAEAFLVRGYGTC